MSVPLRLLLLLVCLLAGLLRAVAGAAPTVQLAYTGALPDRGYSWGRIHTDTRLSFAPADSLRPAQARRYWLKLVLRNPGPYDQAVSLLVLPNLDNTLYWFDERRRTWQTQQTGAVVGRSKGGVVYVPGQASTAVYVLIDLGQRPLPPAIRLQVLPFDGHQAQAAVVFNRNSWAVAMLLLAVMLCSNLLSYARLRDPVTRYYLWLQVGGMVYLTALRNYFVAVLPGPVFSALVLPTGLSYGFVPNNVLMHLSVVLLLAGIGQMTRAYLATAARLPRLDAALRYAVVVYGAVDALVILIHLSGWYVNHRTLMVENLLVLGVVGLLVFTAVAAYRRGIPLARTYLLANLLPLLCVGGVALYHVGWSIDNVGNMLLPELAVVSHVLGFAVAISLRLQTLQRTLLATECEAAQLALDIQAQELRTREIALKNSHVQLALLEMQRRQQAREQHTQQLTVDHQQQQAANQDLREQLEANQRELASTTLYVQQKNALLAELKQQIGELSAQSPGTRSQELSGIRSILQTSLYLDEDWSRFKLHFEQVHPRFFEELQSNYPALTKHEQRLYCYFHINLSTKEIATLLNIDPASVRRAKTRLYKKIGAAAKGKELPPLGPEPDETPTAD